MELLKNLIQLDRVSNDCEQSMIGIKIFKIYYCSAVK